MFYSPAVTYPRFIFPYIIKREQGFISLAKCKLYICIHRHQRSVPPWKTDVQVMYSFLLRFYHIIGFYKCIYVWLLSTMYGNLWIYICLCSVWNCSENNVPSVPHLQFVTEASLTNVVIELFSVCNEKISEH